MKTNKTLDDKLARALLAVCLLVSVYLMVVNLQPLADVFDGRLIPQRTSMDG